MQSFDTLPCPVLVTDRYGRIATVNASLLDLVGGDSQRWCGQSMEGMLPVPSRIFLQTHLLPMVLHDGHLQEIKLEVLDRQGARTPVLANCKRWLDGDMEFYHWVLFVSRERSRFEAELLEARNRAEASARALAERERALTALSSELLAAQEKVRLATESSGIGVWDLNLVTGELIWDAQSYRLHGLEPCTEARDYGFWAAHVHPDDIGAADAAFQRTLLTGADFFSEFRVVWPDGTVRHMRGFGRLGRDAHGQAVSVVGTNIDVTEAVHHAQSLKEARDQAEAASQSKGQFLANMSHEIRTPMNAILGMLALLQHTDLTSRQRDYASKTEGAAKSLLGLLNDILDFSKVDAGKMTLEREPLRPDALLRQLAVVLSANVGAKNIEVLFDVDPALPEVVLGDAMRLQQVLINLCGNAIKFTTVGQVVLALQVQACSAEEVTVQFSVQDTGIGIAPEHQQHIFSGFSQAEASTTRRFGGTGLGLAICKRLVELMGGQIGINSTPGVGSTFFFTITLPVVADLEDAENAQGTQSAMRRALVVDDNPIAGALLVRMVQSLGWTAHLATSGAQALALVAATHGPNSEPPYDVVYMDWQMPEMDGWQTTAALQQWCAQSGLAPLRTVMVSAHGRENLSQRSPDEQALLHGFLVKPVTASMLREAADEQAPGHSRVRQSARGGSSLRQLNGMRILVVEDNLINQQVAEELLTMEGAVVSLAANGLLGVEAVRAAAPPFDAVLMDIQMPVLDGYGATQRIREDLGLTALPIVAMTANAMAGDREMCLARGMTDHVGKPFDMAQLVSLLIRTTRFTPSRGDTHGAVPEVLAEAALSIAGLDVGTAIARMSGLRSLYVRTARDFSKGLGSVVADLRALVETGAHPQACMLLHTLKGNAGTVGATALAQEAGRLETLCADARPDTKPLPLTTLEALVISTAASLHQAMEALEPASAPTSPLALATPQAHAALQELVGLLQASDLAALQRFAELRTTLQSLPAESLDGLDEALQNLDLDTALALCLACMGKG
ncbi:hybrid sensor histidine kinase/response regulator [Rhodoferax aquaticus]|uniref:hybrid sensor histidine kinase/response regulator n=1 Tax=Rhodoferax aquaticus TaxID=2527691 RepID=UPI00143CC51B|nr:response regulator [Rhodoferax aquaticus]